MKFIESKPYFLVHITSEDNFKKIKETGGFKKSVHDLEKNKNQWLGDGVYFWDGNDEQAISYGKIVIGRKNRRKKLVGIYVNIEVRPERHFNLENKEDLNDFFNFIKECNPEKGEEVINLLKILRRRESIDKDISTDIGKFLGTNINLYLQHLNEDCNRNIDMVSCYFFNRKFKVLVPFSRGEQISRQFCIKNINIVNNNIDKWQINNKL